MTLREYYIGQALAGSAFMAQQNQSHPAMYGAALEDPGTWGREAAAIIGLVDAVLARLDAEAGQ